MANNLFIICSLSCKAYIEKQRALNKVLSKTNWLINKTGREGCEVEFAVVKVRPPTVTEWLVLR